MSLKAKLEAVIYAAEEPVTLAQLSALFAADALEWKAEQEAVSAEQAAQNQAAQPLPQVNEEFAYLELEQVLAPDLEPDLEPGLKQDLNPGLEPAAAEEVDASPAEPASETIPETDPGAAPDPSPESSSESSEPSPEDSAETGPIADQIADPAAGPDRPPAAEAPPPAPEDAEAKARRMARQRDREARAVIRQLLDELIASYVSDGRGVEIREIAGGYRMATKPECHDAVRLFVKSLKPVLKLSLPALETLAVIAYKQPVTAPEVNEIRGVESAGVLGSLLARKLIATAGRKPVIGRPILYKTTREFLLRFGLKDVSELPSMEEFEKMAAIELDEAETATEEDSTREPNPALGPEFDEAASEELEDSPSETSDLQARAPESEEPPAGSPAIQAESTPAEAAPAAPPPTEQAETETFAHDR